MQNKMISIDLFKLFKYIIKHIWLPIACAVGMFGVTYLYNAVHMSETYTASGTMYVYNGNPNLVNYQYASESDLDSAVKLIDTYMIVVRSNKVMDVVTERLSGTYPGILPEFISSTLSMSSVNETGVVRVSSRTSDPQLSTDICNAVLDVAPQEIIRVVEAGNIEIIDYARVPEAPDYASPKRKSVMAGCAAGVLACGILLLLFVFNCRVTDANDLINNYTPSVLAQINRKKKDSQNAADFLLNARSPLAVIENYAKLRMNLLYMMVGKDSHTVVITSAISGEGKSTIAANLAISCAMGGKKVLLVDGDMRRACQAAFFGYDSQRKGLSDILAGTCTWRETVIEEMRESLDVLPAGTFPPNPAELLGTEVMADLLGELERVYDLILIDMPPINIVADPLALSAHVAGCLFSVRQNYSDQREIRKALIAAELTGMNVMGFVFYGENVEQGNYYRRKYYRNYYGKNGALGHTKAVLSEAASGAE